MVLLFVFCCDARNMKIRKDGATFEQFDWWEMVINLKSHQIRLSTAVAARSAVSSLKAIQTHCTYIYKRQTGNGFRWRIRKKLTPFLICCLDLRPCPCCGLRGPAAAAAGPLRVPPQAASADPRCRLRHRQGWWLRNFCGCLRWCSMQYKELASSSHTAIPVKS